MASRISLVLVLLTLELLFVAAVGAAGDIQHYSDPQGTIHIDNRSSTSKDKDKGKDKEESGLPVLLPPRLCHPSSPRYLPAAVPRAGRNGVVLPYRRRQPRRRHQTLDRRLWKGSRHAALSCPTCRSQERRGGSAAGPHGKGPPRHPKGGGLSGWIEAGGPPDPAQRQDQGLKHRQGPGRNLAAAAGCSGSLRDWRPWTTPGFGRAAWRK